MGDPIRVLVADDHAIVREGIRSVLDAASGFDVVGEAGTGTEALALIERLSPEVVILDVSMPDRSGLEVARELRAAGHPARILILSVHDNTEYVMQAVQVGAHGYLLKDSPPGMLRDAVRATHAGQGFFSPTVAGRLSAALRDDAPAHEHGITPREREVLVLVARGRTNKEMAAQLGISPRTVETHRENLMRKLKLRTVADLTRYALEHGLLDD